MFNKKLKQEIESTRGTVKEKDRIIEFMRGEYKRIINNIEHESKLEYNEIMKSRELMINKNIEKDKTITSLRKEINCMKEHIESLEVDIKNEKSKVLTLETILNQPILKEPKFILERQLPLPNPINELSKLIHQNAKEHGWWDTDRPFGDIIALCHSELSEALEEYRNGHTSNEVYYNGEKPEGIPVELADCIIRILDYCGKEDIDIESIILEKHNYNKSRPFKHGGKQI